MLQTVRKHTQGWIATVLGILLSLAFVMWGIENYLRGNTKKDLAAKVNGSEISMNQVDTTYNRILLEMKQKMGPTFTPSTQQQHQMKQQILQDLTGQMVLMQAATKAGFIITPAQAIFVIKLMPAFQDKGGFSKARFDQRIAEFNFTRTSFIAELSQTMLVTQVANGMINTAFVLPDEVNRYVSLVDQKREIDYAIIPWSTFKKTASKASMIKYYDQHKNQFKSKASLQVDYIELRLDQIRKNTVVSEQELADYFNANTSFAKQDPKVIAKAKSILSQQKAEQEFLTQTDKLTDLAYTHPNSLSEVATALGLNVKTTDSFTQQGGIASITKNPKILNAAFSNEFIKTNNNSSPIETENGVVVVMRIHNYHPEKILPMAEVENKISTIVSLEEASKQAEQKGQAILKELNDKKEFDNAIKLAGYKVIHQQRITSLPREIAVVGFEIPPHDKKGMNGVRMANGDYALIKLKAVTAVSVEHITEKRRNEVGQLYKEQYGQLDYEGYTNNQIQQSKIKIYLEK